MSGDDRSGRRIVLHVGTMKSGTTSIQSLLFANRDLLRERGVCAVGATWGAQVAGVREMIVHPQSPGEPWRALVEEARAWEGTSVISMEFLGPFIPARVRATVASFGDLPVHVVLTMRDLNRTIPSLWQETVQNGRAWTWDEYRDGVRRDRPWQGREEGEATETGRTFWRQQNAVRILRRWAAAVGWDRISVITLPPPGAPRDALTQRFARVVGFSPGGLREGRSQNASLGAASAQMLQRVNARLAELGMAADAALVVRKRLLAKQVLSTRRPEEQAIGLEMQPWVAETAADMVRWLQQAEVRLEGDWDDLTPVATAGADPRDTPEAELVAAARYGFEGLREKLMGKMGPGLPEWPEPQDAAGAVEALARLIHTAAEGRRP